MILFHYFWECAVEVLVCKPGLEGGLGLSLRIKSQYISTRGGSAYIFFFLLIVGFMGLGSWLRRGGWISLLGNSHTNTHSKQLYLPFVWLIIGLILEFSFGEGMQWRSRRWLNKTVCGATSCPRQ